MRLQINFLLLIFFATGSYYSLLYGQTTLNCDDFILTQQLAPEEYVIGPDVTQITFYLRGGDGGDARLSGTFCDTRVRGGSGSQIQMTFPVTDDMTQANSLKTGGIIRLYVGQPGQNEERGCTPSPVGVFGGGGGASAVLYRDDLVNEGYWLILGIAGGGGGGSRPAANIFRTGQGGQTGINGGNSGQSSGGANGGCGGSTNNAHPGGGVSCNNSNATAEGRNIIGNLTGSITFGDLEVTLDTQVPVTSTGGVKNNHANGGNGFVGGSVGQTAGGGAGGASGGASGNTYGGGGGGSYVTILRNVYDTDIEGGSNGQGSIHYAAISTEVPTSNAVCPSSVVLNLDEDGQAVIDTELLFEAPSSIPCNATTTLTYVDNNFPLPIDMELLNYTLNCPETPGQVGDLFYSIYAEDGTIASQCSTPLSLFDNIAPVASCQNITRSLNEDGMLSLTPADINNGSTDNCTLTNLQLSRNTFDCTDIGNHTVTFTIFDAAGNTDQCTATVTVRDQTPPVARCNQTPVDFVLDPNVDVTMVDPAIVDGGSTDNCDSGNLIFFGPSIGFSCADVGTSSEIYMQVRDQSGNNSQLCVGYINIVDGTPPVARCQTNPPFIELNLNDEQTISPIILNNGSSDACSGTALQFSASQTYFDCTDIGFNNLTLEVQDEAGNTATCTANLLVLPSQAPILNCSDLDVILDLDGTATISPSDVILSDSVACFPLVTSSLSQYDFNTSHIGTNTVSALAQNAPGFIYSCEVTVNIIANPLPVEWLSFSGQIIRPKEVQIEWSTSSETDNHYFDLQHSSDGRTFTTIGRVYSSASTSTTTNAYEYVHDRPLNGWNYYRLQQVDYSGSSSYSNTISVKIEAEDAPGISITPNPSRDQAQLSFAPFSTTSELMVHNSNGQVVGQYAIPPGESSMYLDTSILPAGVYFLSLQQGAQRSIQRLVKID